MNKKSRIILAVASVILIGVYFQPIWMIRLEAPQYPEGIGLNIWVNKITGQQPQDLQNINGLNHYIGMKTITPESIPELIIIPPVIGFLILSGLFVAYKGNKKLLVAWVVIFMVIAISGLVDFYLWEYDYGHDLNPNAPIKVPGMSYQPPLFGSKKMLNITATSLPHIGGVIVAVSLLLGFISIYLSKSAKEE